MKLEKLEPVKLGNLSIGRVSLKQPKPKALMTDVDELTEECAAELSGQAKQIAKQESKLAERMDFDNDRAYYFSVVFRSSEERDAYLRAHKIKLHSEQFVFYEDVKDKL